MKNLIALLLAFGLGVYVGRPAKIELAPMEQKIETCPIQTAQPTPSPTSSAVPSPVTSPIPDPSPSAKTESDTESTKRDLDNEPIDLDKWVEETVHDSAARIAKYGMEGTMITLNKNHFPALAKLKTVISAAGMRIVEEGPKNIGDYVYYLIVVEN